MKEIKILYSWMKKYIVYFIITVFLMGFLAYTRSIVPQFISYTIDSILQNNDATFPKIFDEFVNVGTTVSQKSTRLVLLFFMFMTFRAVLMIVRSMISSYSNENIMFNLRNRVFSRLQNLPYSYFKVNNAGDIIQRCTTDIDVIRTFITGELNQLIWVVSVIVGIIYTMFKVDVIFSLISLFLFPIIFIISFVYYKNVKVLFEEIDTFEGQMTSAIKENITGVQVVKAFGSQKYEYEKFQAKSKPYYDKLLVLYMYLSKLYGSTSFLTMLQALIVIVVGALFVKNGSITVGTLVLFLSYIKLLSFPIKALGRLFSRLGRNFVAINRVNHILEEAEESVEEIQSVINGNIRFENVSFKYEDGLVNVLDDVSFEIKSGQSVAIIGKTGSGKSTISHLIARLFEPTAGKIYINDVDISTINKSYLRDNIGIIVQEPYLFTKDIKSNIAISSYGTTTEDVVHYANVAYIHEDIMAFNEAYDTVVGERGTTLSGGQKQRIAIARMLINKRNVLVFDDSLSAVDNQTDKAIRDSLSNLENCTNITITHRITSIIESDYIIVIEDGTVKEKGTVEELFELKWIFCESILSASR